MEFSLFDDNEFSINGGEPVPRSDWNYLTMLDIKSIRQVMENQIRVQNGQSERNADVGLDREAALFQKYEGNLSLWQQRLGAHDSANVEDCESEETAQPVRPGPRPVSDEKPRRRFHFPLPPWKMSLTMTACCIVMAVFITQTRTGFEVNVSGDTENIVTLSEPVQLDGVISGETWDIQLRSTTQTSNRLESSDFTRTDILKQMTEIQQDLTIFNGHGSHRTDSFLHIDGKLGENTVDTITSSQPENREYPWSGNLAWDQFLLTYTDINIAKFPDEAIYVRTNHGNTNTLVRNVHLRSGSSYSLAKHIKDDHIYTYRNYISANFLHSDYDSELSLLVDNDSINFNAKNLLTFELSQPATIRILIDRHAAQIPDWLSYEYKNDLGWAILH